MCRYDEVKGICDGSSDFPSTERATSSDSSGQLRWTSTGERWKKLCPKCWTSVRHETQSGERAQSKSKGGGKAKASKQGEGEEGMGRQKALKRVRHKAGEGIEGKGSKAGKAVEGKNRKAGKAIRHL